MRSRSFLAARTNWTEQNPFRSFTVVNVLYCSGDLHAGNVTRSYSDSKGVPVQQRGYENSRAVLDWVHANMDSTLSSLIVTGDSAGSLGTQAWTAQILKEFDYEHAAVVPDSYIGVFPNGTQGELINSYGMCDVGILEGDLLEHCQASDLTIQDVFADAMATFSDVAFGHINSKYDSTQMGFYAAIAATMQSLPLVLTGAEFTNEMNKILERYNQYPNYVSYVVTSDQHCYLPYAITYTADTTSPSGNGEGGQTMLVDWITGFPVLPGSSVASECDGDLLSEPDWTGKDYCDAAQAGKVYSA